LNNFRTQNFGMNIKTKQKIIEKDENHKEYLHKTKYSIIKYY
tara:strand:- start:449 stop:574 length:126 start_codon:yes stop_codon:yes gene_type:complete